MKKPDPPVRPAIKIFVAIAGLICVAMIAVHLVRGKVKESNDPARTNTADLSQTPGTPAETTQPAKSQRIRMAGESFSGRPVQTASAPHNEPLPEVRQLLDSLVVSSRPDGMLTDEEASAWKENLRRLIQQGDAVVPAISGFLASNSDASLGLKDRAKLGYASVRLAMIDALMQINSVQSMGALDTVLQDTMRPQEIAQVTQFLEKTEPGIFLQHSFDAVQRALANAASGNLPASDVAPLFQVLLQYEQGNIYTVDILKNSADQWNYYAATALAQLPDGAGVPTLIQIATGQAGSSDGARTTALGALAGMAAQSADAQGVLFNMAQQNSLSDYDWQTLVPYLAGYQMIYQSSDLPESALNQMSPNDLKMTTVSSSNQSFYLAPLGALTNGQIDGQIAFINRLLNATAVPGAAKALQQAKTMLESRRLILASSSNP
jgi:hypothetical protein